MKTTGLPVIVHVTPIKSVILYIDDDDDDDDDWWWWW